LAVQQQREFRVNVRGASAPHRFPPGHGPGTGFETLFAESRQGLVLGGRLGGHVWCTLHQAGRYQPRQADKELLFQVVLEHLEDFLEMTRLQGCELPKYVLRELEDFLRCGVLANGFLRVRCNNCGGSMVVGLTALASQCSSTRL
jgi:hypothetical protein